MNVDMEGTRKIEDFRAIDSTNEKRGRGVARMAVFVGIKDKKRGRGLCDGSTASRVAFVRGWMDEWIDFPLPILYLPFLNQSQFCESSVRRSFKQTYTQGIERMKFRLAIVRVGWDGVYGQKEKDRRRMVTGRVAVRSAIFGMAKLCLNSRRAIDDTIRREE